MIPMTEWWLLNTHVIFLIQVMEAILACLVMLSCHEGYEWVLRNERAVREAILRKEMRSPTCVDAASVLHVFAICSMYAMSV